MSDETRSDRPQGGEPFPDDETLVAPHDGDVDAPTIAPGAGSERDAAPPPPAAIGPYRILGVLGRGGMGVVYEAEQQSPHRRVALKVIRGGQHVDASTVRLFRREAETLARLKHPNIGAIYESGHTADGQHFFAMELVRGPTLDAFFAARGPAADRDELRFRLRLFRTICDAVHYAHQRGVIHRDLKPANIVVTDEQVSLTGGESTVVRLPAVKILDFGLARIIDQDLQAPSMLTEIGVIKGTLSYMSPEQARGDVDAVDVRADVYALGVILYEMLAGVRPYNLEKSVLLEAVRVICEEAPRPLGRAVGPRLRIDGDVETIVGKALEKEPDRRYASAAALGEDVDRFLASQPIVARPPSTTYQLRKLVARHRVPAAFLAVLLVTVVGFGAGMAVLYGRADANYRRALAAEGEARDNFDLAKGAVDRYLTNVAQSPELQQGGLAELRHQLLSTARDFYGQLAGRQHGRDALAEDLALSHLRLGDISRLVGDNEGAQREYRSGLAALAAMPAAARADRDHRRRVAAFHGNLALALNQSGQRAAAEAEYDTALALEDSLLAEDGSDRITRVQHGNNLDNLGQLLEQLGRGVEAESYEKAGLELRQAVAAAAPDEPAYVYAALMSVVNLSSLYARQGRLDEARALLTDATARGDSLVAHHPRDAEDNHVVAAVYSNLGGVEMLRGQYAASAAAYHHELATRESLVMDHPAVVDYRLKLASSYTNLGELEARREQPAAALPWFDKADETLAWVLAREPRNPTARYFRSYTCAWHARALDALGRHGDAIDRWEAAIRFDDNGDTTLVEGRDRSRQLASAGR